MKKFSIGSESFELDGTPLQIISGAMHYFRIHPDLWKERIATAKKMGLNTIETYVAWNFHSPRRGEFNLEGQRDFARYLRLIHEAGMNAIVRPGPYICAEWDNGGIPTWLSATPGVEMRRTNTPYLEAVAEYFDALLPVIEPLQVDQGGPVLMVQVENEYGAYGNDKDYLRTLVTMMRDRGITVPLFTCDQADDEMLSNGGLPELHKTATFGSRSKQRLQILRRHQPTGPLMCMEYWNGWFDAWGQDHHVTDPEASASDLQDLLESGASVNFYMVHGGTNFGFTNGANDKGNYRPTITSYDYDAPMAEDGTPTAKYDAFQSVISDHLGVEAERVERRKAAPEVAVDAPVHGVPVWSLIDGEVDLHDFDRVPTHEEFGAFNGFTLYRSRVRLETGGVLDVGEVRDRAQVFCNRVPVGVLDRSQDDRALTLPALEGEVALEILVEDQGRVNYGPRIGEAKGLIGPVRINGEAIEDWQVALLPVDDWAQRVTKEATGQRAWQGPLTGPAFYVWQLPKMVRADHFLLTTGWGKGNAWVNEWNLGRYWGKGPQQTLYVPAPTLTGSEDYLVTFELLAAKEEAAQFVRAPQWTMTSAD